MPLAHHGTRNIVPVLPINRPIERCWMLPVFSGFTSQDTLKRGLNDTKAAQRWHRVTLFETQKVLGVEVGEVWCNRVAVEDIDLINSKFKGCWCLVFFWCFCLVLWSKFSQMHIKIVTGTLEPGRTSCPAAARQEISVWQKEVWKMVVLW